GARGRRRPPPRPPPPPATPAPGAPAPTGGRRTGRGPPGSPGPAWPPRPPREPPPPRALRARTIPGVRTRLAVSVTADTARSRPARSRASRTTVRNWLRNPRQAAAPSTLSSPPAAPYGGPYTAAVTQPAP